MAVGQVLHTKCSIQCLRVDDRVGDTAADQFSARSVLVGVKPEFMPRLSKKLHRGLFLNFLNAQTVFMSSKYGQEATGMGQAFAALGTVGFCYFGNCRKQEEVHMQDGCLCETWGTASTGITKPEILGIQIRFGLETLTWRFLIPEHLSYFFGYQHFRLCKCALDNPDLFHLSWL
ncbi:hypothetical protein LXL04_016827 [Taraxacum kok-saghyz]